MNIYHSVLNAYKGLLNSIQRFKTSCAYKLPITLFNLSSKIRVQKGRNSLRNNENGFSWLYAHCVLNAYKVSWNSVQRFKMRCAYKRQTDWRTSKKTLYPRNFLGGVKQMSNIWYLYIRFIYYFYLM